MTIQEIRIPDIGGEAAEVVELLVKVGDAVIQEQGLISLESDKATMDVPSSAAGIVKDIKIKVGDKVKEGDLIILVESQVAASVAKQDTQAVSPKQMHATASQASTREHVVKVPDMGGDEAEVVEVLVKPGQSIAAEEALISLESDKATMEVPSPFAGEIGKVLVKVGDKVKQGSEIAIIITAASVEDTFKFAPTATSETIHSTQTHKPAVQTVAPQTVVDDSLHYGLGTDIHASPAVRRIGREFGVDLRKVSATGEKGRITVADVQAYVKQALKTAGTGHGLGLAVAAAPVVDFAKFGEVEFLELNKIKKLTAKFLHRNWVTIPHVTQFDEADITDLEAFRAEQKKVAEQQGVKLTPLVFIMKAVVAALKEYPQFNSSLDASGEKLVLKKYFHIGIAVDTPEGLVVPVIRDVNCKGILDLARELGEVSEKARKKQLKPQDMQGACFSISSLGGIGGTGFTPIINMPEVAILGVSKSKMQPVYVNDAFVPRLMLPLALSYDHRVVDGAEAARFITFLSKCLSDIRRLSI